MMDMVMAILMIIGLVNVAQQVWEKAFPICQEWRRKFAVRAGLRWYEQMTDHYDRVKTGSRRALQRDVKPCLWYRVMTKKERVEMMRWMKYHHITHAHCGWLDDLEHPVHEQIVLYWLGSLGLDRKDFDWESYQLDLERKQAREADRIQEYRFEKLRGKFIKKPKVIGDFF
jgi:hypothetical protein